MSTETKRLNEQGRVVIPRAVREHLGVSGGDDITFVTESDGTVRIMSARAIRVAVWANNHGGDAGDSTLDVRQQRMRDQDVERASQAAIDAEGDDRSDQEIVEDLMSQLV